MEERRLWEKRDQGERETNVVRVVLAEEAGNEGGRGTRAGRRRKKGGNKYRRRRNEEEEQRDAEAGEISNESRVRGSRRGRWGGGGVC